MIQNYLKIAIRNLLRNKTFSAINVVGLALGIATCLIIMLFVYDELSYDRFNEKADRIYRVVFKASINDGKINEANVMPPTAQVLKNDYPEVLDATRLRTSGSPEIVYHDKKFKENSFASVDANFFQVFTLPLLKGDAKTALVQPNTAVITKELAKKYFGNEDPIGKVLFIKSWNENYKITGLIDKVPHNSHFHFDIFGSMASVKDAKIDSWMTSGFFTYLVLPEGYDYKKLEAKLPQVIKKYMGPQIQVAMGMSLSQFLQKGNQLGLFLQPLTSIHLDAGYTGSIEASGNIQYVYIFGAIAIFMLLIACINFMNLSTAGASKRAKEVGVRKVLGSVKQDLITQFLFESVLLSIVALLLSLMLVQLALPIFNDLAEKDLQLDFLKNPLLLLAFLLFGLLVGVLAGSYPAFFLSSFNPVEVLKGKFKLAGKSISLRSGLVVFQFFISIALIIGTTVVYQQIKFIQSKDLGYAKDQLLIIRNTWSMGKNEEVFRQQILQDPRVLSVTSAGYLPAGPSDSNNSLGYPDGDDSQIMRTLEYKIDDQYIPTMGMKIIAGRNFSKDFATDSTAMIINETAAKAFGWGKNAVGHTITRLKNNEGLKITYRIIGVVKDFHFKSLHESITPLLMVSEKTYGLTIKVKGKDVEGLLASLKNQWQKFNTEEPFAYSFMDELFEKTYQSEQKISVILSIFSGLTIFVACLGLFGLATFTAEQRTKEIGVRKVLGASVQQIVTLLSKEFLKLVLVACCLAFPLGYWLMDKWLQDFAYRIDINAWVFVLAGVLAVLIALLTISYQAIKAALANPVKSLRTE
ncbi:MULTISPECIES: ABC transporter permease [unclassified Arcicella]|uniref:ABC transporter permease n=1 Tax=unclassified Arcicella TaxID=2644986 RepID=UPI0028669D91|nr:MULTISPECIES: ABC transporter permease [unclassified Arcicella]MDR6563872.1 putative ABC transport system permease protein [Arcicella sp. BE51]MDR6813625.1 putative ABC transport system permease protein [Arcicella sp. BE140]MDR6824994.1 putative ABC transport system permease protein [Arcicella sp. BE139]